MVTPEPHRPSDRPARWAAIGVVSAGLIGGIAGLVVGIMAHPATAWFATFELGIPSAVAGGLVGLVAGTIAQGIAVHASGNPGRAELRWPNVIVTLGELAVLGAVSMMDWASRVDELGRATFTNGPTRLLVSASLASLLLSLMAVVTKWQWPRWLLLATTIATAITAVVVALSRIAAANNSHIARAVGTTTTSYEPGAAVGVGAAFISAGFALVSVLHSSERTALAALGYPPAPHQSSPSELE